MQHINEVKFVRESIPLVGKSVAKPGEAVGSFQRDLSPEVVDWLKVPFIERYIKTPLRRPFNFIYRGLISKLHLREYKKQAAFGIDQWLWGQRGNDYAAHRHRVNKLMPIKDKKLLIAGCGTGRDILSWLKYEPSIVVGLDYFNYQSAWAEVTLELGKRFPGPTVRFRQGDLSNLEIFDEGEFDVIGSDAVFEHITDLSAVAREFYRVLRPGGLIYATFGPLWHAWHGDHFSGWDEISSGYNHLALSAEQYKRYLDEKPFDRHSEDDGRTWIEHGLFSYLKPVEYLAVLEKAGFRKIFTGVLIEPKAVQCLKQNVELKTQLLQQHQELDLLIAGMTLIFEKPKISA